MVVIISYSSNTSAPYNYGGFVIDRDGILIIYFLPVGLPAWDFE